MRADLLIRALLFEGRKGYERFSPSFNMMNSTGYDMQNVSPGDVGPIGDRSTSAVDTAKDLGDREVALRRVLGRNDRGEKIEPVPTARELSREPKDDDFENLGTDGLGEPIGDDQPRINQRQFVPGVRSSRTQELLRRSGAYPGAFVRGERGMSIPVKVTPAGRIVRSKNKILLGGFTTGKPKKK